MGLFDFLKVEVDLPDLTKEQIENIKFQTKDTDEQYLVTYRISPEGRLLEPQIKYGTVPEDERPYCKDKPPEERTVVDKFIGSQSCTVIAEKDLNYHGWLNFYGSIGDDWFEYNAKFTDGKVVEIQRIKD